MYRKLLIILIILIGVTPFVLAFEPSGKFIWFNIEPATNSTLGGMLANECPIGELPYAIYENGTFACKVP